MRTNDEGKMMTNHASGAVEMVETEHQRMMLRMFQLCAPDCMEILEDLR